MSNSDNTQRKFDKNFPRWQAFKLWVKHIEGAERKRYESRQAEKRAWKRDTETESGI